MPKLFIFDLDNTLTDSRKPIPVETARLLKEILRETRVAVISGAAFWQFEKELLEPIGATEKELEKLYVLTTSGAELWAYIRGKWQRIYGDRLKNKNKKRIREALMDALQIGEKELEPLIDDRFSGMTYSALGKDAPPDIKNPWDPDQKKRQALVAKLAPMLPGLELKIGGTTSIDFTNDGIDKAYGVKKIIEYLKTPKDDVLFVGDALFQGGNDNPVQNVDVPIIGTKGPENTREIIKNYLNMPETIEAGKIKFPSQPVAFFSAEYGLDDNSLRFAGGLGVLSADYIYEARDMEMSVVCVGLWYKEQAIQGYSLVYKKGSPLEISIPFENKTITARVRARKFGSVWLLLMESDDDALSLPYSLDEYTWVKQDLILGMGGILVLAALDINPVIYHLNEGHSAFAAFELIAKKASLRKDKSVIKARRELRERIVATKHTILKAGVKIFPLEFKHYFTPYCQSLGVSADELFDMGADSEVRAFSGTHFVLNSAGRKNAVSELHQKFEKELHPKSELLAVTNGIYKDRWLAPEWANKTSLKDILKVKSELRKRLVEYANQTTGSRLDPDVCTIVWARRFAAYKRPETIITDLERLKKISSGDHPVQFIISGKVYLDEPSSQKTLDKILELTSHAEWKGRMAYLPDYSIGVAHKLVEGADIWLNTPKRGKEACGTSGMKAGLNGALELSVADGWIEEADWKGIGWILPEDDTSDAFYDILEHEVAHMFYEKKGEWIKRMKKTREIIEKDFTTKRMMTDYINKLYKLEAK